MKIFFTLFLIAAVIDSNAADSLTIRQVYDFNVGDIFDYKITNINTGANYSTVSYERVTVLQKTISQGQDSITYLLSPNQAGAVLTITNLDSIVLETVHIDSAYCTSNYIFADTSTYHGFVSNSVNASCGGSWLEYRYTARMGETMNRQGGVDVVGYGETTRKLVFYTNGTDSVGTPYYLLIGLPSIPGSEQFKICPTITHNEIKIEGYCPGKSYVVYDITGKQVLNGVLQAQSISVAALTPGMYLLVAFDLNNNLAAHKFFKDY